MWKVGASQFRFCKHCSSTAPIEAELEELPKNNRYPGTMYLGGKYDSSPSILINHMWAKHAELLPAEVSEHRKTESGDVKDSELDSDLLAQWAEEVVLGKLHSVALIDDVRATLGSRLKGLAGRKALQISVDDVTAQIRDIVHKDLSEAKKFGSKFVLMADTWKVCSVSLWRGPA